MLTKTFYSLLLGLILNCLNLFKLGAQETWTNGYIITNSGEKREGLIQYVSGNRVNEICHFKSSDAAQIEDYEPGQIREYYFDRVKCASKSFAFDNKSNVVFAECLFESPNYVLYRYKRQYIVEDKTSNTEPFRFGFQSQEGENEALAPKAKKDDARLVALTQSLLMALGTPVEKLTNTLPRVDRLKQILIDYHEAKKINYKVYEDLRSEMHFTFGWAEASLINESSAKIVKSDLFDLVKIPTSFSFSASLPILFSSHPSYDRFSVMALPGIRNVLYEYNQQIGARKYNFSFNGTYLQSLFLLKYKLIPYGKKIQLGVHAGPNVPWLIGNNAKLSETYRNLNNRDTLVSIAASNFKNGFNVDIFVGVDLDYELKNGNVFYAGIRGLVSPYKSTFVLGTRVLDLTIQTQPIAFFIGYRPKTKSGLKALGVGQK